MTEQCGKMTSTQDVKRVDIMTNPVFMAETGSHMTMFSGMSVRFKTDLGRYEWSPVRISSVTTDNAKYENVNATVLSIGDARIELSHGGGLIEVVIGFGSECKTLVLREIIIEHLSPDQHEVKVEAPAISNSVTRHGSSTDVKCLTAPASQTISEIKLPSTPQTGMRRRHISSTVANASAESERSSLLSDD